MSYFTKKCLSQIVTIVVCWLLLFVVVVVCLFFFEYRYVIQNMQSGFVKTYVCLLLIVCLKVIVTVL